MSIWVSFWRFNHHEGMPAWINDVVVTANIVRGVVDSKDVMTIQTLIGNPNRVSVVIREGFVSIPIEISF